MYTRYLCIIIIHLYMYQCQYSQVRQYNWLRSSQWHDFFLYLICFPLLFVTRELTWNVKKFRLNIFNMTGRRWKRRHSVWILICFHLKDFRHFWKVIQKNVITFQSNRRLLHFLSNGMWKCWFGSFDQKKLLTYFIYVYFNSVKR